MRGRIAEWFWQWRLKLAGRPLTQPGCSRCGYPVQGLTSAICPECGADHRIVGIAHPLPPLPPRTRRWLFLLAWSCAVLTLAFVLNPLLLPLTPRDLSNHRDYAVDLFSQSYPHLTVRQIGYGWGWKASPWIPDAPRSIWITLGEPHTLSRPYYLAEISIQWDNAYATVFRFDPPAAQSRKLHESNGSFTPECIDRWLESMDPDLPADLRRKQAADLYLLATPRPFTEPPPAVANVQVTSITGQPGVVLPYHGLPWVIAFWLLIYLAGCLVLRRIPREPPPKRPPLKPLIA